MKPVVTETTNYILKAPLGLEDEVVDLPATLIHFREDNSAAVESCFELTDEEVKEIVKSKRIYFLCFAETHPPIMINTKSVLSAVVQPRPAKIIQLHEERGRY